MKYDYNNDLVNNDHYLYEDLKGSDKEHVESCIYSDLKTLAAQFFSYFDDNITTYQNDMRFLCIDQWDPYLRSLRDKKMKQTLTFNYLYAFGMQIIGEASDYNPDIIVRGKNSRVSQEMIDIKEELLRQINYNNKFDSLKQEAYQQSVFGGYSAFIVSYDYENENSFSKVPTIRVPETPTSCFWDPYAKTHDKSDGEYCGYLEVLPLVKYHNAFPDSTSTSSFNINTNDQLTSMLESGAEFIQIGRFWRKERYQKKIAHLSNGEDIDNDKAEDYISSQKNRISKLRKIQDFGNYVPEHLLEKIEIVETRMSDCYKVRFYVMNGAEILECGEWPSKELPVVFVDYHSINIEGKQITRSFHRYAQDTQRYLNYVGSEAANALSNSHHVSYMASTDMIDGSVRELWLSPQTDKTLLLYKKQPDGSMPTPVPPPVISPSLESQFLRCINDLQNILGRFESNRGQQDNAIAGVAIKTRIGQGMLAGKIPFENFKHSIEQVARVELSFISSLYDTKKEVTLRNKNGKERQILINVPKDEDDELLNDMSVDSFDVTIEAGVSVAAQKDAALAQLQLLVQSNPALNQLLADLMTENMDLENMPVIVERIRKLMVGYPIPQIISEETGMQPPPPQPQQEDPLQILMKKEMEVKQQEVDIKKRKQELDEYRAQLEAQSLIADNLNDKTKTVLAVKKINAEIEEGHARTRSEDARTKADQNISLIKHFTS